ncbi:DesA family fatty acid desaturase [Pseudomonas aeruginosa]|uniref:DesA family fatty acid desaturase n=1 Tax=Pseudomonas aeruginosa TaxID=287 RepID=UPI0031DBF51A
MWYHGILQPTLWQLIVATLALTHVSIISVTLYLHRHSAHCSVQLHPALKHFFRFWLWLTTGMNTRAWTAVHRRHHACCETPDDPHSPRFKGLLTVLLRGAELYRAEARNPETLQTYGRGCPDDWLERRLYSRFPNAGLGLMLGVDLVLFGVAGLTVWALQMIWIAFWAAGVINGLGHAFGYRTFECPDDSSNLLPWGVLVGGEELHNNHHAYPGSAKLSVQAWEFDLGWAWICLLRALGLAQVNRGLPTIQWDCDKRALDLEASGVILRNRLLVMAQYGKRVMRPLAREESARCDAATRHLLRRASRLLVRDPDRLSDLQQSLFHSAVGRSQVMQLACAHRLALQRTWSDAGADLGEVHAALKRWVTEAEASGIRPLREFAGLLCSYSLYAPRQIVP